MAPVDDDGEGSGSGSLSISEVSSVTARCLNEALFSHKHLRRRPQRVMATKAMMVMSSAIGERCLNIINVLYFASQAEGALLLQIVLG